jgi:hypothetical protein
MGRTTTTIRHNKKALVEALEASLGVVTTACKKVGIDRRDYYRWMEEDPEFKEKVEKIGDIAFDFVESALYKQIQEGNTASTIFWLKTKARHRGYSEKLEISGPDGLPFSPIQITLPMSGNLPQIGLGSAEVAGVPPLNPVASLGAPTGVGSKEIQFVLPAFLMSQNQQRDLGEGPMGPGEDSREHPESETF